MKSIAQKLEQVEGLLGTRDLTTWEAEFVESVLDRARTGGVMDTTRLSPKQVEVIDRIYGKHFA